MLDAKLAKASMPRALDARAMWKRQIRSESLEQSDRCRNGLLLSGAQVVPPPSKLIRVFDLPDHNLDGI